MNCRKCSADIPDGSIYCMYCGRKQTTERRQKTRGNGQGTVFRKQDGKYRAEVTLGYYFDDKGIRHRRTRAQTFSTKKEAVAALPRLLSESGSAPENKQAITFKELYDKWLPTHNAGKSTLDCYRSAMKYFQDIWHCSMGEIDIDDLQECMDSCPKGKRTRQNMKAVCGLIYKYGIPRNAVPNNLNLAQYLIVGEGETAHRASFTDTEIRKIKNGIGQTPYADYVYCLIYLGFRPSEFLSLDCSRYDREEKCFTGGGKTAAGTNRVVTISPKIVSYIESIINGRSDGPVFCRPDGSAWPLKEFSEKAFYPALEACGIDNPMVEVGGGVPRHKYTPHSCRHTFATLMKRINAPSKDKQELIGHASEEMLKYYQDVDLNDLRRITDAI